MSDGLLLTLVLILAWYLASVTFNIPQPILTIWTSEEGWVWRFRWDTWRREPPKEGK